MQRDFGISSRVSKYQSKFPWFTIWIDFLKYKNPSKLWNLKDLPGFGDFSRIFLMLRSLRGVVHTSITGYCRFLNFNKPLPRVSWEIRERFKVVFKMAYFPFKIIITWKFSLTIVIISSIFENNFATSQSHGVTAEQAQSGEPPFKPCIVELDASIESWWR